MLIIKPYCRFYSIGYKFELELLLALNLLQVLLKLMLPLNLLLWLIVASSLFV
jgi:hypothetical protein